MEQLNYRSFKDLDQLLNDIAGKFFLIKKIKDNPDSFLLNEQINEEIISYRDFIYKVEKAYNSLNDAQKNLINNEFFYQSYHEWWAPIYSKASFYRYKKAAMEKFLGAFYDA